MRSKLWIAALLISIVSLFTVLTFDSSKISAQSGAGFRISHANCTEVLVVYPQAPDNPPATVSLDVSGPNGSTTIVLTFVGFTGNTARYSAPVPDLGNGTYTFSGASVENTLTVDLFCHVTNTPTNTPTDTPTNTPTNTPTDTPTNTPTDTPTNTATTVKFFGCTPGYYKNHLKSWVGYSPNQTISSVFSSAASYPKIGSATLLAATQFKGGSSVEQAAQILLRAAVPALLNAANFGSGYPLTTSQIIAAVNSVLDSHNRSTILALAAQLDKYNNAGCPLS
jgi:hypothetical protein